MDLFLRKVDHPQARDNYRVILKGRAAVAGSGRTRRHPDDGGDRDAPGAGEGRAGQFSAVAMMGPVAVESVADRLPPL